MVFDELGRYEKMQDPEPRKAEEIRRAEERARKKNKADYSTGKVKGSVSVRTMKRSSTFITLAVWLFFILAVGYGAYMLLGIFTNG